MPALSAFSSLTYYTHTHTHTHLPQGPTHRLEINPLDPDDPTNGTVLRMSDLNGDGRETTDIVVEQEEDGYDRHIDALTTEVGALKAEVSVDGSEGGGVRVGPLKTSLQESPWKDQLLLNDICV